MDHSHNKDVFSRHRGPVTCAAFIGDGTRIITSAYDSAVSLFNTLTGEVQCLGYHRHLGNRIVVNAAGTRAASCSSDYTTAIWDLENNCLERILLGHADDVEDFAFIGDNKGASVARDCRVLIWNLDTGAIERIIEEHEKDVLSVSYHEGKLITSGDDMTMRVWDVATGKNLRCWGPFDTEVDTSDVDTHQNRAVLGCDDGVIRIFDLETGDSLAEIKAHDSAIKKVAVSPVNGDILSAAYDQKLQIWDGTSFELKKSLEKCSTAWERAFNWSPDGTRIATGTFDGTVVVWDAATGKQTGEYGQRDEGNSCLNEISAGPDGHFASVSDAGFLEVGRISAQEPAAWKTRTAPATGRVLMNAVCFDASRNRILCGSHDQNLHSFDWNGHEARHKETLFLGEGPINCIRTAHHKGFEGEAFVACYSGAIVRVRPDGQVSGKIRLNAGAVKAVDLHPHEAIGVSCSADGGLLSWQLDGTPLLSYPGHLAIVDDVSLDPTGQWLASVSRDFTLKIFELKTGRLCHAFSLGKRSPKGVLFFDEQTVVVTNYWGQLMRADLSTGRTSTIAIADNGISAIDRMDGHLLVTSYNGSVYQVDAHNLTVRTELATMCQKVMPAFNA